MTRTIGQRITKHKRKQSKMVQRKVSRHLRKGFNKIRRKFKPEE